MEKRRKRTRCASPNLKIKLEPVYLTEAENDARIKRLSTKIFECLKMERNRKKGDPDDLTDCGIDSIKP